jgi:large subunit ribosomal protein L7/L12
MAAKTFDKLVEEISKLTLTELSDLVKQLETTFGVSAAMPTAAAGAAAAEAPAKAAEKSEYKVTLTDAGSSRVNAIKALRAAIPTMGMVEAKTAVENVPTVLGDAIAKDKATEIKQKLEEVGAKVELS